MRMNECEDCGYHYPDQGLRCPECGSKGSGLERMRRLAWMGLQFILIGSFVVIIVGLLIWVAFG